MAAKVNTKFVLILILAMGAAGALIGGLYVMNLKGDATRNIRQGDAAMAAGDVKKAHDYYGRAVSKEPGNMQYLALFEKATLQLVPKTADEAIELYREYMGILNHAARHDSGNAETHLRLLRECMSAARRSDQMWEYVLSAANDMWQYLPESDPQRQLAKIYKAIATFHRMTFVDLEAINQAIQDLEDVLKITPDSDLAWANLAFGQLVIGDRMRGEGRSPAIVEEQMAKADEILKQAVEAVPNGPEVAKMVLLRLETKRENDQLVAKSEELVQAATRLASLLTADHDLGLITESANLMMWVPDVGFDLAIEVLNRMLEKQPNALDSRLLVATFHFWNNDLESAERVATEVYQTEPMTVSFVAQVQPDMRRNAISLIGDIHSRRWDLSKPEDRAQHVKAMEDTRLKLVEHVSDPANNPLVLRCDGKIAFAKGEYSKAAQVFDRLVREAPNKKDPEILMYSALCLERVNQIGLAYERVEDALELRPGNPSWLITQARLAYAMGHKTDAAAALEKLPKEMMETEEVRRLVAGVNSGFREELVPTASDPATAALSRANESMILGDMSGAKSILLEALTNAPNDIPLLQTLAAIEMREPNFDKAREYLERALAVQPENPGLQQMKTMLQYDDPIEAMVELAKMSPAKEVDRNLSLLTSLRLMASQQTVIASRLDAVNDAAGAAKAREMAARARQETEKYAALVQQASPEHPALLDHLFTVAVDSKNWTEAEQVIARSKAVDADQANGNFTKGRYQIARATAHAQAGEAQQSRAMFQEAVKSLEAAIDRLQYAASVWRALGYAYQNLGNFSQAERAYEQAYKCNPSDIDIVRAYLPILSRRGEYSRALRMLRDAVQLAPTDVTLRHNWLLAESEHGDLALAMKFRQHYYLENPDDRANAASLARMFGEAVPTRELIAESLNNTSLTDQRWTRMEDQEREQLVRQVQAQWYSQSDKILDGLIAASPNDLSLVSLRAALLQRRGMVKEGEEALTKFIAAQGESAVTAAMLLELGRYQVQSNHFSEGIKTLEDARRLQDPTRREIDRELGQTLMRLTQFDRAVTHLDEVIAVTNDRAVIMQTVECLMKSNRLDEAEKRLSDVIRNEGDDAVATMLASGIAELRGDELRAKGDAAGAERKYAEQLEILGRAEIQDPLNPTPRLLLAQSYSSAYARTKDAKMLDEALAALDRAEKARSGMMEVSMMRVRIFRDKGDREAAVAELRRALEREPASAVARRDLIQLYVEMSRADEAIALINEGIRMNPTLAAWYDLAGDLHKFGKRDAANALAAYRKAYELSPTPAALLKLSDAALAVKNPDCKGLIERLSSRVEEMDALPPLREFYARALFCGQRKEEALEQLRLAYVARQKFTEEGAIAPAEINSWFQSLVVVFAQADNPGILDASAAEQFVMSACGNAPDVHELRALAKLWVAAGDPKIVRSIELQQQALNACPADDAKLKIDLTIELSSYLLSTGNYKDAIPLYETVLKTNPDHLETLNNLAYLLAEEAKDPAKALPYATRAAQLAPDNPAVLDTVGWVHFLAGKDTEAREFLSRSINLAPNSPEPGALMHMAELDIKSGDRVTAQQLLEQASKLKPDAQTQQKIDRLLDDIRKQRAPGG